MDSSSSKIENISGQNIILNDLKGLENFSIDKEYVSYNIEFIVVDVTSSQYCTSNSMVDLWGPEAPRGQFFKFDFSNKKELFLVLKELPEIIMQAFNDGVPVGIRIVGLNKNNEEKEIFNTTIKKTE